MTANLSSMSFVLQILEYQHLMARGRPLRMSELNRAVINNDVESLVFLLANGAKIHEADFNGRTPLCYALLCGHKEMALILIREGATFYRNETDLYDPQLLMNYGVFCDKSSRQLEREKKVIQTTFVRESNWRRRKSYAMFLSSLKTKTNISPLRAANHTAFHTVIHIAILTAIHSIDVKDKVRKAEGDGIEHQSYRTAPYAVIRVFRCTDIQRLIGSFI
jgi:ankyrin repeat protein